MKNTPFNKLTYTVVDTETTGYSPKYAKMVEIAAVKIYPDYQIDYNDTFSALINPEIEIPYNAYKVHKISNEMVQDKPFVHEVLPSFLSFASTSIIAGHNINFDMRFIEHEADCCSIKLPFHYSIDTVKLAKKAVPGLTAYKLDNLIDYFHIDISLPESDRHRALFDALNTAIVLTECFKILEKQGICDISHL
ncbi:MAG: 3'-5' exonuclease [Mucispirillum sp.]|nr:3'-5' exonuclease [Mucispirillum sp.]